MICTGHGSADTRARVLNDGRFNPHPSAGFPYATITLEQIYGMVADPPSVPKADAQWIGPSTYHLEDARSHTAQREKGSFLLLAADIDQGNPSLEKVVEVASQVLGDGAFVVYSSRGATEENRKWRILIPLAHPIRGDWYSDYADAFFDALEHFGLSLDRTLARTGQLVYLPNRGEYYRWHVQGQTCFDAINHGPLTKRAAEYHTIREKVSQGGERTITGLIGGYKTPISELLNKYSFTRKGSSDHWRSPYSTSGGFPFQDRGDHWISLSDSDSQAGLGKPTANGSRYGDAFDLLVHFEYQGNFDKAIEDLKKHNDGAASSGILVNYHDPDTGEFFDILPDPSRQPGNGYDIMQAILETRRQQLAIEAAEREEELKRAAEINQELEQAKAQKWGGEWTKEVPFQLNPSALEWAAWHAPGVIGQAVRARSRNTARHSLVPLLAGAIAAVSHLSQGKFVSTRRQHVTPTSLMIFIVGDTGSGKGDSFGILYDMLGLVDRTRIKASRTKSFASGQSLTDYLMHHNSDVIMLQQEGGASRKAGKGDANFESLMGGVTEAYTAFSHGIEVTHTKSDEKEAKVVNHPSVAALMASTPKKLFASIEVADSESGWLGRNCFLPVPTTYTNLDAVETSSDIFPNEMRRILNWLVETPPPLPGQVHPDVWQGNMQAFHLIRFSEEAGLALDDVTRECDRINTKQETHQIEKAVVTRTAEAISRMATVAALAKGQQLVDADSVRWAQLVVNEANAYVMSQIETFDDREENDTFESRARRKIKEIFDKYSGKNPKHDSAIKKNDVRWSQDGFLEIRKNSIRRKLKDTKIPAKDIQAAFDSYTQDGDLYEMAGINGAYWLRFIRY